MDFTGKRGIVMGCNRGIEQSIALGFASAGASVSVYARSSGPFEATQKEIKTFDPIDCFGVTAEAQRCLSERTVAAGQAIARSLLPDRAFLKCSTVHEVVTRVVRLRLSGE